MNQARTRVGLLAFVFFVGAVAGATAQSTNQAPSAGSPLTAKIALSPLVAPPGDAGAKLIAAATTRALTLMLKLTGSFTVVGTGGLDPIMAFPSAVAYYRKVDARVGMFGTVTPGEGASYTITVQYWQSLDPAAPPKTFARSVSDVSGAVDAAYALALKVVAAVSDRTLPAGTIVVENTSHLKNYSIYADGELAATNADRIQLPAGRRTVTVTVPGAQGEQPIQTFQVDVQAGKTFTLSLTSTAVAGRTKTPPVTTSRPRSTEPRGPTGSLSITTSPPGAEVVLDGHRVGTTPLELAHVGAGSHLLELLHKYFLPAVETTTVVAGRRNTIDLVLAVNHVDPAIAARLIKPSYVATSSLLWSAVQVAHFAGLMNISTFAPGFTTSFLTTTEASTSGNVPTSMFLDADLNLIFARIGGRLAGNSLVTTIDDAAAAASAATLTTSLIVAKYARTSQNQHLLDTIQNTALIGAATTMVFDAVASYVAANAANNDFLSYVVKHGSLPPPREVPQYVPHRIILASGGDSLLRVGYREQLIPDYLALEETIGFGAVTLNPLVPALTGGLILSGNPWGKSTGRLRPELFIGVRASSNVTTSTVEPVFGTGNEWVGRNFDIFARGGFGYEVIDGHWDQFFSIGTRIF